jgi:TolB-like protein/tetratricopeptide (TPR) repeat protein
VGSRAAGVLVAQSVSSYIPLAMLRSPGVATLVAGVLLAFRPLAAQCPDGSAPPCRSTPRSLPAPNSIAVLYFDNLTRDSAYAYLADGLTEDLITLLGRVARLDVKSRYESARIRGAHGLSPADFGRELHVAYFVGGSVQPGGGRIRVNAELIETRSGRRVWSGGLTVSGTDPLAVQESVTTAVVQAVVGRLLPEERAALARRSTRDSAAYDLYLRGRFVASGLWEQNQRQGLELYRQALMHDSTFAPAWAGIAQSWYWLSGEGVPRPEAFAQVRQAAERALALDSGVALAYVALAASAQQVDRDYARAESLVRRALALDPGLADAHAILSWVLIDRGRPNEALAEADRAWQLDSLSITIEVSRWNTLQWLGRANDVLAQAQVAHLTSWQAYALLLLRRCGEASSLNESVRTDRSWVFYWLQTLAAACLGQTEKARAALDSLAQTARKSPVESIRFATAHAALGDVDDAFLWLERADENRETDVLFINQPWLWWLASVQADARFLPLVRRLGIPWPAPQLSN